MNNSPELKTGFPEHLRIKMFFSLIKPSQFGRRTSAVPHFALTFIREYCEALKTGASSSCEISFSLSEAQLPHIPSIQKLVTNFCFR